MSYEVINEELKIAKCSITDLTIGQVHNFLESWGDDSKIGTLTMFYDREKELLVLNEDNDMYETCLMTATAYLSGDYERRKELLTRIDTASTGNRPLQCSETFFDGKKSILNTKECKNLHLCYNRKRGYLGCFTVQFSVTKGWGVIKTYYVPEEDDIQNVLQTVFENY